MKRFQFKLQVLLDLKTRIEDEKKRELADVNAHLLGAQRILKDIEDEWYRLQEEEVKRRREGCSAQAMGQAVAYRLRLQDTAIRQELEIQRIRAQQETKRQALVKATQEKKALENLRERRYEEWKTKVKREEMKMVDDICQIQYVRANAETSV